MYCLKNSNSNPSDPNYLDSMIGPHFAPVNRNCTKVACVTFGTCNLCCPQFRAVPVTSSIVQASSTTLSDIRYFSQSTVLATKSMSERKWHQNLHFFCKQYFCNHGPFFSGAASLC